MTKTRIILWSLLGICVVMLIVSITGRISPKDHNGGHALSVGKHFHVSLLDSNVVFYSNDEYGPYRGSMLSLAGDPNAPVVRGFGPWPGIFIYARDIRWPNGDRLWTLMFTLWYPVMLIVVALAIYEKRHGSKQSRLKRNCCVQCGYSLEELKSTSCPECGQHIQAD